MGNASGVMDERESILSCVCRERDVEIVRHVRPTELSLERLKFIWNKLKDYKVLFNDWVRDDFEAFINHFVVQVNGEPQAAGLMWDIDDVGMFILNDIVPAVSASAHYTFWDGRSNGRIELSRMMLQYVFNEYQFKRIESRVPLYAKGALAMIERVGFIQEGRIRDAALYEGEWFDVNVYSILPEDLINIPEGDLSAWRSRRMICWGCGEQHKLNMSKEN